MTPMHPRLAPLIAMIALSALAQASDAAPAAFAWTAYDKEAPPADMVHADETKRHPICRARLQGGLHPGRLSGDACAITFGETVRLIRASEVLVAKAADVSWVAAPGSKMPAGALAGGFDSGRKLFICRAKVRAVVFPGTVVDGSCNIAFGSHELKERPYEVLVIE